MNDKTTKPSNFTAAQEAMIRNFKPTGPDGKLCHADAKNIAALTGMEPDGGGERSSKSVVAKINRMGLPYAKQIPTRKDGSKVETKADLVAEISRIAGVQFENLTNAARGDLVKLRDFAKAA